MGEGREKVRKSAGSFATGYQVVTCPQCEFENHPSCRLCIGCGKSLGSVSPTIIEPEPVADLDPGIGTLREPPSPDARQHLSGLLAATGWESTASGSGWKITVPLEAGRRQKVHVMFTGKDEEGEDIVSFLSLCAPVNPGQALGLLRFNSRLTYCAVAVLKVQEREVFGVVANLLAATADAPELRKTLLEVARRADALEAKLMAGRDSF